MLVGKTTLVVRMQAGLVIAEAATGVVVCVTRQRRPSGGGGGGRGHAGLLRLVLCCIQPGRRPCIAGHRPRGAAAGTGAWCVCGRGGAPDLRQVGQGPAQEAPARFGNGGGPCPAVPSGELGCPDRPPLDPSSARRHRRTASGEQRAVAPARSQPGLRAAPVCRRLRLVLAQAWALARDVETGCMARGTGLLPVVILAALVKLTRRTV